MKREKKDLHLEYVDYICFGSLSKDDRDLLAEKGFTPSSLPFSIYSIDLSNLGRLRHGIGMRNESGGVEFFSYGLTSHPVTIHDRGITIVKCNNRLKSHECCAFANFLDYMSYVSLHGRKRSTLPKNQDCIILNHPNNCMYFIMECEFYDKINLFLPNSIAGRTLAQTIVGRNPLSKSWSPLYGSYKSLSSFLEGKYRRR